MTDPESAGTESPDALPPSGEGAAPEPGMIERGMTALGMGGDDADVATDVREGVVTDEARELTADEEEEDRKKQIRKNMARNAGGKHDRVTKVRADRRDPRADQRAASAAENPDQRGPAGSEE